MTRRGATLRLVLLTLAVSSSSLALGLLAARRGAEGGAAWPWLLALVAGNVAAGVLHFLLLRSVNAAEAPARSVPDEPPAGTAVPPQAAAYEAGSPEESEHWPPEGAAVEGPCEDLPPGGNGREARVLLVEDNPVNQEVLTLMLQRAGHRVTLAGNGREALEAMEVGAFDLVLMDLQMPEVDGLRCTKLIRQREKAAGGRVPIVAVTANALETERQRCLEAGMDGYLVKPVRGHELSAVVERLVGRKAEVGATAGEVGAPEWLASLRELGFDEEGIARLARAFLDTVPGRMEDLRKAVAENDAEAVHRTAHTLKGSLAVFAAQKGQAAAARLMALAQQGEADGYAAALGELDAEVGPLLGSMREVVG